MLASLVRRLNRLESRLPSSIPWPIFTVQFIDRQKQVVGTLEMKPGNPNWGKAEQERADHP
jgi:hypothetical protein